MSFNQAKLTLLSSQSIGGSNLYSYTPANGDTLNDAITTGYFAESRFIGSDGWLTGYLFCVLKDGSFLLQIFPDDPASAELFAGGAATDIAILEQNVRAYSSIDMGGIDYTMSIAQAQSALLNVTNLGDGTKKLIWPDGAVIPASQQIINIGETKQLIIKQQSTGLTDIVYPNTCTDVAVVPGVAAINLTSLTARSTNGSTNGILNIPGAAAIVDDTWRGKVVTCSNAAATVITIPDGLQTNNLRFYVTSLGAGGVSVVGSLVVGNATLTQNSSCMVARDAMLDSYVCV